MRTQFGRYVVSRRLGMGSFGEVYLARDPDLARDVAIKVVGRELVGREALELLLREARAVAALQHPGLVTIYDVGAADNEVWVVMEYVPGETLRHRLERGPLPLAEVIRIGTALCGALTVAHLQGVIHRDIKPANILLTPAGEAKLADFGTARAPGDRTLTDAGTLVGTLMYMSPQQAMGEMIDARSDLFSLAAVLYEALTGVHPFVRGTEAATLYGILHEPPTPPRPDAPPLDDRTRAFFHRALAKDAGDRHPDAIAFAEDLLFLLEPEGSAEVRPAPAARTGPRLEAEMVGRDAEFQRLRARLDRARTGDGGAVLLAGEAGIGKSRLLSELARVAEEQHVRVVRGRALFDGGPAYHPWRQVLSEALDGPALGLTEGLETFVKGQPDFTGARAASLRRLLQLDAGDSHDLSGPDQLWEAAVTTLQAVARRRPLLVMLDDLHWADTSSLQLFRFAAAQAHGHKMLLVGAFRPEEAEGEAASGSVGEVTRLLGREEGVEVVQLARLDRAATSAMVDELLAQHVAGTRLGERIFTETEGNPLFILEVAKLVSTAEGGLEDMAIPTRVVDVVEHRLDRLTQQERDALEVASVEGEYFHVGPIASVLELTRIRTLKLLQGLERRHRIVRPAEQRFRFDHGKIREVILTRLAEPLKREYHGVVASCLLAERNGTSSAVLAHHLAEAGDEVMALPHRRRAAVEAAAVFANEEALHHLGLALATLEAHPELDEAPRQAAEVRLEMAKIHLLTGSYATAEELFGRVVTDGEAAGAGPLAARALLGQGECEFALGRYDRAMERLDQALFAAVAPALQARIHVTAARVYTRRGEFDEALAACARSEALARELGDGRHRVFSLLESGEVCVRRGAYADAQAAFESALDVAEENDDLGGQARALGSLATVARHTGDFPAALGFLERSAAICRRMGEPLGEARMLANQGNVHLNRGQWAEARRCFEPALRSMRALGARHPEAVILNNMSVASSSSGDYDDASRLATECLELMRELGDPWATAGALDNLGVLQHRRGRSAEARRLLRESLRMRRELGDRTGLLDGLLSLALVEASLGDTGAAVACTEEALAAAEDDAEAAAMARGLRALCEGATDESVLRERAAAMLDAAARARERGDAELATARALPAGELLARAGDWATLEPLARDETRRCAALGMRYEEAWARLLLARAALAEGRADDAAREARAALAAAEQSDLRGIRWRAAAWLADAFSDADSSLPGAAADQLAAFLEEFPPDERDAYVEAAGVRALLDRWLCRARERGDADAVRRLATTAEHLGRTR